MAFHRVVISDVLSWELESCRQWLVANKLSLHFGTTETILFESQRKLSRVNKFEVYCDDKIINPTNSVNTYWLLSMRISRVKVLPNPLLKKPASGRLRVSPPLLMQPRAFSKSKNSPDPLHCTYLKPLGLLLLLMVFFTLCQVEK